MRRGPGGGGASGAAGPRAGAGCAAEARGAGCRGETRLGTAFEMPFLEGPRGRVPPLGRLQFPQGAGAPLLGFQSLEPVLVLFFLFLPFLDLSNSCVEYRTRFSYPHCTRPTRHPSLQGSAESLPVFEL